MSAPQGFGAAPAALGTANGIYCVFCGSTPAAPATIRSHRGFLIMMQFVKQQGPFCRDCGMATYRRMTAESAILGWWGIVSAIANPITMLLNIAPAQRIKNLPAPIPGSPRMPLDPGKPLFRRAGMLGLLIPLILVPLVIVSGAESGKRSPSSAEIGDCVVNRHGSRTDDSSPDVEKVSCSDPAAQGKVIAKVAGTHGNSSTAEILCSRYPETELVYTTDSYTLCLKSPR
ncbi:LppU/SCO3897 family protein [Nocardia thailandica]